MQGTSTLTQKGQIAIPKGIRDYFDLKPSDKLHFSIEKGKIVAEPIFSVKEITNKNLLIKSCLRIQKNPLNWEIALTISQF